MARDRRWGWSRGEGHRNRGFSVAETLVVIFVFGILSAGVLGLAVLGSRTALENERRVVALAIAQEQLERIRSLPFDQLAYAPDGAILQQQTLQRNDQPYAVETLLEATDPAALNQKVQVTVAWPVSLGRTRDVQLVSYVSGLPGGGGTQRIVYAHTHNQLYTLDALNPAAGVQAIGFFGTDQMRDIAMTSTGEMYAVRRGYNVTSMYRINPATAQATYLAQWGTYTNFTVGGEFLNDDIFVIGGTDFFTHFNVRTNTVVDTVRILTGTGEVTQIAGDMVRMPNDELWFVGSNDGNAEYCWQGNPTTGVTRRIGTQALNRNNFPTVLGIACANDACTEVVGFGENGLVYRINTTDCTILSSQNVGLTWTGASRKP